MQDEKTIYVTADTRITVHNDGYSVTMNGIWFSTHDFDVLMCWIVEQEKVTEPIF